MGQAPHLLRTRELELWLRREGAAYPDAALLTRWAEKTGERDTGRIAWADWLCEALGLVPEAGSSLLLPLIVTVLLAQEIQVLLEELWRDHLLGVVFKAVRKLKYTFFRKTLELLVPESTGDRLFQYL